MFVLITEKIFIFKNPDNFKFFSFYSSFRKTKFFPSSSFFKAFTNASHKNFLKTSRKLFSQCLVRIRFLASSKKYNVVGMYILEREDPRNPLALESEEFVSMRSRFLFKLTKSNLQSRLFTTACNFAFPHFICDVTPTLYLIVILIFLFSFFECIIIIIENSIDRTKRRILL